MQAIDFLDKLLRYDHQDRLTAREAMVISSISLSCLRLNHVPKFSPISSIFIDLTTVNIS